ncbi:hypothetical protein KKB69_02510 [Patescibacteria group bacterium]|nr:hypothetical protein [Patescibacteria group bacterium]
MDEFRQKSRFRKIFFSRPVFLLFLAAAVLLAPPLFSVYKKSRQAVLKNKDIEKQAAELGGRLKELEANIGRMGTEAGIEKELRSKFQIKKPGEDFVVIIDNTPKETKEEEPFFFGENSFLQKLLDLIKF